MNAEPPFRVPNPFRDPVRRAAMDLALPAIERALGFTTLNSLYERAAGPADGVERRGFAARALDTLGVSYLAGGEALSAVPADGPLIVVANHPFGAVDGLILTDLLTRVRPDVRLLANELLQRIPGVRELLITVDAFGNRRAAPRNGAALRTAIRWVAGGGVLVVFPAGEVSHRSWADWNVTDPPWTATVGHLVRRTGASVLPVHFGGSNSPLFHMAGLVHARLRTAMLPRELLRQQGRTVVVQVGTPVPFEQLAGDDAAALTEQLRVRTYVLAGRNDDGRAIDGETASPAAEPVAAPEPAAHVAADIARLPRERCLVEAGQYQVFVASAGEIPSALDEIGRLREIAFRRTGEGTGRARDRDRFDETYLHLVLWNAGAREIVGSYRLGAAGGAVGRKTPDPDGLYTSTLFHDTGRLVRAVAPALELGRSFVRPEYQREYAALMLLWKGIGAFVVRHPEYRYLFGSVSISNAYRSASRDLLMTHLRATRLNEGLARLVRARNPPPAPRLPDWAHLARSAAVRSLDAVDRLVAEIEPDGKGIPVLLRQYLKLGARLVGFNVDPAFGHVLDGLMVVDLAGVPAPALARYMGRDGAAAFLARHA